MSHAPALLPWLLAAAGCLAESPASPPARPTPRPDAVVPTAPAGAPVTPAFVSLSYIYEPPRAASARPPVVVLLHGLGTDEHDLSGLARSFDPRFAVASVRAPYPMGRGANAWFDVQFRPGGDNTIDVAQWEASTARLEGTLRHVVEAKGLDPEGVFLFGFSQGGMMAATLALTAPGRYAGAVIHSSRLLPQLEGRLAPPGALKGFPLLVLHGRADATLPVRHGRVLRDALQPRGPFLTYEEGDYGHTITEESLATAVRWLRARLDS